MSLLGRLFGTSYRNRAWRDQHTLGTGLKNLISPVNHYGTCFGCNGSGRRTFDCGGCGGTGVHTGTCNKCHGSGTYTHLAKPCFRCEGTGHFRGHLCRNCAGTGIHKPAVTVPCRGCHGSGTYSATCRRCDGTGDFDVTCKKCGGSGWHRF